MSRVPAQDIFSAAYRNGQIHRFCLRDIFRICMAFDGVVRRNVVIVQVADVLALDFLHVLVLTMIIHHGEGNRSLVDECRGNIRSQGIVIIIWIIICTIRDMKNVPAVTPTVFHTLRLCTLL